MTVIIRVHKGGLGWWSPPGKIFWEILKGEQSKNIPLPLDFIIYNNIEIDIENV